MSSLHFRYEIHLVNIWIISNKLHLYMGVHLPSEVFRKHDG